MAGAEAGRPPFRLMTPAANQARTFLRLLAHLRPRWRTDSALPRTIQALLAGERRFGSRDRRLYRELIYTTLRYLPWIEPWLDREPDEAVRRVAWLAAESPATRSFCAELATGEPPAGDKSELLPAWFRTHCPEIFSGAELEAQLRRAPLWLRLQTDERGAAGVLAELEARGWQWRRSSILPDAIELLTEADVTKTDAWHRGLIEVQDLGSQMILASVGIAPGGRWLDACAGAGGKTLQLARLLGPRGHVDADDVRAEALAELRTRAERAGWKCHLMDDTSFAPPRGEKWKCHPLDDTSVATLGTGAAPPDGDYDGVLVDAPCSGSGTWRRFPHLKWCTTPELVTRRAALQRKLLARFAAGVRPGGRLVYATCSLSHEENDAVVAAFLAAHPEFRPAPLAHTLGFTPHAPHLLRVLPARHDTDGFFVASLRRA